MLTFSVTPGYFNPPHFWIWTALSHCFLEIHFWEVLVDIFTVVLVGKLIGKKKSVKSYKQSNNRRKKKPTNKTIRDF